MSYVDERGDVSDAFTPDMHDDLSAETRREIAFRERLATDPIMLWMRTLVCQGCQCPVTLCSCADEMMPFCDPREVKG